MTRKKLNSDLEISSRSMPNVEGFKDNKLTMITSKRGISEFSYFASLANIDETLSDAEKNKLMSEKFTFPWEAYSELDEDHGLLLAFEILSKAQIPENSAAMLADIEKTALPHHFEIMISELEKRKCANDGTEKVFLTALWLDRCGERLSSQWFAAMANYAYYVLNDDFRFGFFVAHLKLKEKHENNAMRGEITIQSAREGGKARSRNLSPRTIEILQKMENYVYSGHTVRRAAQLTHEAGFGASAEANRGLWKRRK